MLGNPLKKFAEGEDTSDISRLYLYATVSPARHSASVSMNYTPLESLHPTVKNSLLGFSRASLNFVHMLAIGRETRSNNRLLSFDVENEVVT